MGRSRSHKSDEHLRGQIRELKKLVRQLRQQLRHYNRFDTLLEDALEAREEEQAQEFESKHLDYKISCPKCSTGFLSVIDLGKTYHVCDTCTYRKKTP